MIAGRLMRMLLFAGILLLAGLGSLDKASGHEIRPALLNIVEQKPGWYEVTWKIPVMPGYEVDISPVLPASLAAYGPPASYDLPGAMVQYSTYQATEGSIDGLSATQIDVMVRINFADGTSQSAILRPMSPSFTDPAPGTTGEIGQLFFVLVILMLERSFRVLEIRWPRWAEAIPAYSIGGLGAFWTIQRLAIMY